MPLFEVAVIEEPTKKEVEEQGAVEKLVFGPKAVVARDAQGAVLGAILADGQPKIDLTKAKVLVRPFA